MNKTYHFVMRYLWFSYMFSCTADVGKLNKGFYN